MSEPSVVFVAGCSYGGTTLLGVILGSDPDTLFAGEINQNVRHRDPRLRGPLADGRCSCGERYDRCPLWGTVLERRPGMADLNPAPGFSRHNARALVRALRPGFRKTLGRGETDYGRLVDTIRAVAREKGVGAERIVDSSKSIHSLDALARSRSVRLRVIHLVRDGVDVAASYKRRGYGAYRGMAAWTLVHVFLRLYLRRSGIAHLEVAYASLCESPARELERINAFLGTRIDPARLVEAVRRTDYHLFGGNRDVRRVTREFEGIRMRRDAGSLSRVERALVAAVVVPVGRLLAAGGA